MRKMMLSLFLSLLWCVPAWANPIAYSAFFASPSVLVISGANGNEYFDFGFPLDIVGPIFINSNGIAVGMGEFTDDAFLYAAIYGYGGFSGSFVGGGGISSVSALGNFLSLGWPFAFDGGHEVPTVVSFDDTGLVTGYVSYYSANGIGGVLPMTWQVDRPAVAVPEPGTLALISLGGLAGMAFGVCQRNRLSPPS